MIQIALILLLSILPVMVVLSVKTQGAPPLTQSPDEAPEAPVQIIASTMESEDDFQGCRL